MAYRDSTPRRLAPPDELTSDSAYRELWALLVGISSHAHAPWNLRYAHRDAEQLAELLKTPAFGALDGVPMKVLLNEQATTAAGTNPIPNRTPGTR